MDIVMGFCFLLIVCIILNMILYAIIHENNDNMDRVGALTNSGIIMNIFFICIMSYIGGTGHITIKNEFKIVGTKSIMQKNKIKTIYFLQDLQGIPYTLESAKDYKLNDILFIERK